MGGRGMGRRTPCSRLARRGEGQVVADDGTGGHQLAEHLTTDKFVEELPTDVQGLVLVDHVDGQVAQADAGAADHRGRLGDPLAWSSEAGPRSWPTRWRSSGRPDLAVTGPRLTDYLVAPKAEALAQLVERPSGRRPDQATREGKEIAGRLASSSGRV